MLPVRPTEQYTSPANPYFIYPSLPLIRCLPATEMKMHYPIQKPFCNGCNHRSNTRSQTFYGRFHRLTPITWVMYTNASPFNMHGYKQLTLCQLWWQNWKKKKKQAELIAFFSSLQILWHQNNCYQIWDENSKLYIIYDMKSLHPHSLKNIHINYIFPDQFWVFFVLNSLTLVTLCDDIELGHHWFRGWLVALWMGNLRQRWHLKQKK